MNSQTDRFERLREFLGNAPCHFCIVFSKPESGLGSALKWTKAVSRGHQTKAEIDKLAKSCIEMAENSYQNRRDLMFRVVTPDQNRKSCRAFGLTVYIPEKNKTPATNSEKRYWWCFSVGSGATHSANCVIVAVVSAKTNLEVRDKYISKIQEIMKDP